MKRKRSPQMASWLRWLRLHGACSEGVKFVRRYSSPQSAWRALAAKGYCGWMHWLVDNSAGKSWPTDGVHINSCYSFPVCSRPCAASILRRFPKVPDFRSKP